MSKVDWSKAPEGAEFYHYGECKFYKTGDFGGLKFWNDNVKDWCRSAHNSFLKLSYEPHPNEWPSEERIDITNTDNIQKAIQAYNIITGKDVSSSDVQLILLLLEQVKKYSKP